MCPCMRVLWAFVVRCVALCWDFVRFGLGLFVIGVGFSSTKEVKLGIIWPAVLSAACGRRVAASQEVAMRLPIAGVRCFVFVWVGDPPLVE